MREARTLGAGVQSVQATAPIGGDLLILMKDGRLQRCPPLTPFTMPTRTAAPAQTETPAATPAEAAPARAGPAVCGG